MTLDELKALEAAATPGPWELDSDRFMWGPSGPVVTPLVCRPPQYAATNHSDLPLIVATRTMLPRLIAVAEAAKWVADGYLSNTARWSEAVMKCRSALADLEAP